MQETEINTETETSTEAAYSPIPQGADAMFELGLIYCLGRGVEPNLVVAHKWFNLAASFGCEAAKEYRAEIVREMSAQQVAQAQREARMWKDQAASAA